MNVLHTLLFIVSTLFNKKKNFRNVEVHTEQENARMVGQGTGKEVFLVL